MGNTCSVCNCIIIDKVRHAGYCNGKVDSFKSTAGPGGSAAPKHAAVPPTVTAGRSSFTKFEQALMDLETVHRMRVADIFERAVRDAKVEAFKWVLDMSIGTHPDQIEENIITELHRLEGGG